MGRRPPLQTHNPQFPLVLCRNLILIPDGTDIRSALPISHIHYSSHAGCRGTGLHYVTRSIQHVCQRYTIAFPPSRAGSLCGPQFLIATSRQPVLLVRYLEIYLSGLERWLSKWSIAINVSKSSAMLFAKTGRPFRKPRAVELFGEPIQLVEDARYLGVTHDKKLTWSKHRTGKRESGTETGNAGKSPV